MEKSKQLNFIDGEFTAPEAKELLMDLFTKKMKFHEMKNFSSVVRFGDQDKLSKNRIESLKSTIDDLSEYLNSLGNDQIKLRIQSKIEISLKDE